MHMHKEHNGAAPVQKSCNLCLFTSHLSRILKNHINRNVQYLKSHMQALGQADEIYVDSESLV